jgi:carbon-monoxide dehydrogenase large subunit
MQRPNAYVGYPLERIEDPPLLRGKGRFVDDIEAEGVLRAAFLRSSIAHGKLLALDVRAALAVPGVRAVYSAADISGPVPTIPLRLTPMPELEPYRQPVIVRERIRHVGEILAVVVADTAAIAEDALDLIKVEIEQLPAVSDIGLADLREAECSHAPAARLFDANATNRALTYEARKGSVEAAFAEADYTRRESFYVHRHMGAPMECRGVLALWDAERGHMRVFGATKVPFFNRRVLANLLGLPQSAVDMIEGDAGGSFGVRGEFFPEDFWVPFAARALGRPVKWIEDRREHFLGVSHARDVRCTLEIACKRDGTILGLRGEQRVDMGAYVRTNGNGAPRLVGTILSGPYRVPNVGMKVHLELTNKVPSGTYRGPGRYEADFFRERLFDMAAADLGLDRVVFRRRNLVSEAEMPYPLADLTPAPAPSSLDSGAYETVLDMALEKAGWTQKQALQGRLIDGRWHGLAVGCFIEGGASGPSETAKITLASDGVFDVCVGSSKVGQGVATIMSQIAADALGVPIGRIRLFHGSTTYVSEGYGSYGSRSTVMGGSAILICARALAPLLSAAGAKALGVGAQEIVLADGEARAADGRAVAFAALDKAGLSVERTFHNSERTHAYGTHVAHVAVDAATGRVEIIDYVAVEDAGVIVNPLTLHGQAIGAIVQGLGGTLLEHLVYDADGQLVTTTFADYLTPLASDFPNIRAWSVALRPSPLNPLGAKGAGEGGIIPVGGLIANAVANALQSLNVQPRSLPLSPPRLWALIDEARQAPRDGR